MTTQATPPVAKQVRDALRSTSRFKAWEPVFWLLALASPFVLGSHALIINEIAIVALFAISLDLVLGYSGIVSLGHAAFFGMGAYTAALFAKLVMPDPLVGLAVAIGVSALLGGLCSLTVLRGSDLTRLMVTLGVALLLLELANKLDWLTGGADGLQGVVMGPLLGKFEFDLAGRTSACYSLMVYFAVRDAKPASLFSSSRAGRGLEGSPGPRPMPMKKANSSGAPNSQK